MSVKADSTEEINVNTENLLITVATIIATLDVFVYLRPLG